MSGGQFFSLGLATCSLGTQGSLFLTCDQKTEKDANSLYPLFQIKMVPSVDLCLKPFKIGEMICLVNDSLDLDI